MPFQALTTLTKTATSPLLTGTLLYLLTLSPPHIRAHLLSPLQRTLLPVPTNTPAGIKRFTRLITVLKLVFAVGLVHRLNGALNALAWNNWRLWRRSGGAAEAWKFSPGSKEELVLVTGASSGFGYEMVKRFAGVARVVAVDVVGLPVELEGLEGVSFYQCDIADFEAVERVCARVLEEHGCVGVLVNNAGIGIAKSVLDTTNAESQHLMQVNLLSHLTLIRALLPAMLAQRKGHIVSIASMASFMPVPGLLDYCISKIGALYVTEGLRAECLALYPNGDSICTTSVHPSWHRTGILKDGGRDLEKRGIRIDPPERVAEVVVKRVLEGRSGRVCVPESQEKWVGVRGYPRWVQDIMFGLVGRGKTGGAIGSLVKSGV